MLDRCDEKAGREDQLKKKEEEEEITTAMQQCSRIVLMCQGNCAVNEEEEE